MKKIIQKVALAVTTISLLILSSPSKAIEMVIGEEYVKPGITFVFEGAVKDHVMPMSHNLAEGKTDVHIEARVNWSSDKEVPKGAPRGGFVPYLKVHAEVTNERTGEVTFVTLTPHINLVDNFHYARNMALPGKVDDTYTVAFYIDPPQSSELSLHKDWVEANHPYLMNKQTFVYENQNFEAIAKSSR